MNENLKWAWHPQRGKRQMPRLKPGWQWCDDVPADQQVVTRLRKPGLLRGAVGLVDGIRARKRGE